MSLVSIEGTGRGSDEHLGASGLEVPATQGPASLSRSSLSSFLTSKYRHTEARCEAPKRSMPCIGSGSQMHAKAISRPSTESLALQREKG